MSIMANWLYSHRQLQPKNCKVSIFIKGLVLNFDQSNIVEHLVEVAEPFVKQEHLIMLNLVGA